MKNKRFMTLAYDTSVKRCPMFSAKTVPSVATNSTHGKKEMEMVSLLKTDQW